MVSLYPMPNNPIEKAKNSPETPPWNPGARLSQGAAAHGLTGIRAAWPWVAGSLLLALAAWIVWLNHGRARGGTSLGQSTAPDRALLSQVPKATFTEITKAAGIHFVHNNGAYGEKLLPETTGGGCAFFDYDNDG